MSNCGLPDGVMHQHVERCWQAGFEAGYLAAVKARDEDKPKRQKLPPLTGDSLC